MISCHNHQDQPAAGMCRACGHDFCESCLVHAFGEGKQPFCVECAVHASTHDAWDDRSVARSG